MSNKACKQITCARCAIEAGKDQVKREDTQGTKARKAQKHVRHEGGEGTKISKLVTNLNSSN